MAQELLRKSSQEVEIDHLLAEEFSCDPTFAARFLECSGLPCGGLRVVVTTAEPSLGGDGFGDLLVEGIAFDDRKVALLIEDKITAGPASRQAERYATFASLLIQSGFENVWTILVAPASYQGERSRYDAFVSLETIATIIVSNDPLRCAYRRGVIERALAKKASTGVRVPDPAMHALKAAYLRHASEWCAKEDCLLKFPALRESYAATDNWIEGITHPSLPAKVKLRHRFWTTSTERRGRVDLIIKPADQSDHLAIANHPFDGARVEPYSKGRGVQLSLSLAELRQHTGFDETVATQAISMMENLVAWHRANADNAAS